MAVDGGGGDGGDPLVVHLVDVLVDGLVVQESEKETICKVKLQVYLVCEGRNLLGMLIAFLSLLLSYIIQSNTH